MIRVLDEARSVNFYQQAFGLRVINRLAFASFTLVYLRNDETDFELERTIKAGRIQPYAIGDGYGHLAMSVADHAAEHARMAQAGFSPRSIST